jgi:hypothetical protein
MALGVVVVVGACVPTGHTTSLFPFPSLCFVLALFLRLCVSMYLSWFRSPYASAVHRTHCVVDVSDPRADIVAGANTALQNPLFKDPQIKRQVVLCGASGESTCRPSIGRATTLLTTGIHAYSIPPYVIAQIVALESTDCEL